MLPESSLSSDVPVGWSLLQPWPSPRCWAALGTDGAPGRLALARSGSALSPSLASPRDGKSRMQSSPSPRVLAGAVGLLSSLSRATRMQESGGRRRRLDPSPCSRMRGPVTGLRAQGQAMTWWWHGGGRFVPALLPLLGETLTLKLCANGEVTKCFKARRQRGGRGKLGSGGGKRVPQFSAQRSLFQPPPWEQPASGLRLPAMCPFLLWYWPALAGHLHRQKSRGRRRRKDGGARPAAALPAESDGKQRQDTEGKDGDVEERLSERGGMGSFSFSSVCPGEGL